MIAAELGQRYAQGEGIKILAREFGLSPRTVAKTLRAMGVVVRPAGFGFTPAFLAAQDLARRKARERRLATGDRCKRCEILLAYAPKGEAGLCGWCEEEGHG